MLYCLYPFHISGVIPSLCLYGSELWWLPDTWSHQPMRARLSCPELAFAAWIFFWSNCPVMHTGGRGSHLSRHCSALSGCITSSTSESAQLGREQNTQQHPPCVEGASCTTSSLCTNNLNALVWSSHTDWEEIKKTLKGFVYDASLTPTNHCFLSVFLGYQICKDPHTPIALWKSVFFKLKELTDQPNHFRFQNKP